MIERLDEMDGDTDLEPEDDMDAARDDGCGLIVIDGRECWGSHLEQPLTRPEYGIDQTADPTNAQAAQIEHRAVEMGLERSPSGGWRYRTG